MNPYLSEGLGAMGYSAGISTVEQKCLHNLSRSTTELIDKRQKIKYIQQIITIPQGTPFIVPAIGGDGRVTPRYHGVNGDMAGACISMYVGTFRKILFWPLSIQGGTNADIEWSLNKDGRWQEYVLC